MKGRSDVSAMQYMRAHGDTPGPTHRPLLTGAIGGALAAVPSLLLRGWSNALATEANGLKLELWQTIAVDAALLVLGGVLYAAIFRRSANDARGGWLFGISYGFLIWMVGPVALWQTLAGQPLATGKAAMGLLASQIVYGLVLGGAYPFVNRMLQTRMK
ncbi:MAG: hypothetical protein ACK4S4_04140 [Pyrinomonadaceae bacterium]